MRGGALTLVALLVATITLPAPAGAAPPWVVQEYNGHFDLGCAARQLVCFEEYFHPMVEDVNYFSIISYGGPLTPFHHPDIEICALGAQRVVMECFSDGRFVQWFIPAHTLEFRVRLPGLLDLAPTGPTDYTVWLSCYDPGGRSSAYYCDE